MLLWFSYESSKGAAHAAGVRSMTTDGLFGLAGRTAVITGGARGIGRVAAEVFLQQGAEVIVTSRDAERAAAAERELSTSGTAHALVADLSSNAGVARFAQQVLDRFPAIHVLVNNAGMTWGAPLESYPAEAFSRVLQLDAVAPFQLVQALLAALSAASSAEDPARIINIGSIDGWSAGPFQNFGYGAAKAALHHLTIVLARELAPRHITVNCLALGPIQTKMTSSLLAAEGERLIRNNPLGRLGRPQDVCAPLLMLAGPGGAYLTGTVIPVDGGFAISRWCDG
jgi:NAD(P)-dependent dehydrogenase (short-subunit alcohol dehydrogenase family)